MEISEFIQHYNVILIVISWFFAFGIGSVVVFIWKKGMNSAIPQTHAAGYVIPGSLNYNAKTDRFLYSRTIRTRRQTQNSSGGGGLAGGAAGGLARAGSAALRMSGGGRRRR